MPKRWRVCWATTILHVRKAGSRRLLHSRTRSRRWPGAARDLIGSAKIQPAASFYGHGAPAHGANFVLGRRGRLFASPVRSGAGASRLGRRVKEAAPPQGLCLADALVPRGAVCAKLSVSMASRNFVLQGNGSTTAFLQGWQWGAGPRFKLKKL